MHAAKARAESHPVRPACTPALEGGRALFRGPASFVEDRLMCRIAIPKGVRSRGAPEVGVDG